MESNLYSLNLDGRRDELFASAQYPHPFSFNNDVAAVFDDMVSRSIPLYEDVTRYSCQWAARRLPAGGRVYDLGCSTGTTLELLARLLPEPCQLVGFDNSPSMLAKAEEKLMPHRRQHRIDLRAVDLMYCRLETCQVVIMNYTLQFLPVAARRPLLKEIFNALEPGGWFFVSEKLRASTAGIHETMTFIYEDFKRQQGYTQSEIARKKEALENVLVPFSEAEIRGELHHAGFKETEMVMRWNNFASFVACKEV